jgi:IMP cyclohydrolase
MTTEARRLAEQNLKNLSENDYPGRGVILGRLDQDHWGGLYWIMGRSVNSRNRCFRYENEILRTEPADLALVEDPSLILYNALRRFDGTLVVSNGSQTDVIVESLKKGKNLADGMDKQYHEPDEPNFTPRISGVLDFRKPVPQIWLSSLRKSQIVNSESDHAIYHYRQFAEALGVGLTTYLHNGSPLPIYDRPPMILPLVGNLKEIVEQYWKCLQSEHLISLAGFQIDASTLEQEMHIINRYLPKSD